MSERICKKDVARIAGVSERTLRNHREQFRFLDDCRLAGTRRPTYDGHRVREEMRRRKLAA